MADKYPWWHPLRITHLPHLDELRNSRLRRLKNVDFESLWMYSSFKITEARLMQDGVPGQNVIGFADAEIWGGDSALVEIEFSDNRIHGLIPVDRITAVLNPFSAPPWHDGQAVSLKGVKAAIDEGRTERRQYSIDRFGPDWTSRQHEERIAWLVLNRQTTAIEIEFSHPDDFSFSIDDGNHRLAAAIYRGDALIPCQLGGYFDNCVRALGVICRPLQRVAEARRLSA